MAVTRGGSGAAPILLAPGHLCDARIFAPQIEALGLGAPWVAETGLDADLKAMAARLLAAAPRRFALIGFSMGAMLAAEVIHQAPERVAGAALLGGDAGAPREKEIAWRTAQIGAVKAGGRPAFEAFAAAFMARCFTHAPEAEARLGRELRAMAAAATEAVFERQARALSSRRDRHDALARYDAEARGPLLFLCGAEDRLCPPLLHHRMREAAPNGALTMIPDCGHMAMLEHAAAVSAALRAWRDRLGP